MTNRRTAYLSALKFHFQHLIYSGTEKREAWRLAKATAAAYVMNASSDHLNFITL